MTNISLKNIPNSLYDKIKKQAKLNKRSINSEILYALDLVVSQGVKDCEEILVKARKSRASFKLAMSPADLLEIINTGRP